MPRVFKVLSGEEVVKILLRFGYEVIRQKGSHVRVRHDNRGLPKFTTVPNHDSLKQGTLNSIYKEVVEIASIDRNELDKNFKNL